MNKEDFRILKNVHKDSLYRIEVLKETLWSRIKRVFMPNTPPCKEWKMCGEYGNPYNFYSVEGCNKFIENYIRQGEPNTNNWEVIKDE